MEQLVEAPTIVSLIDVIRQPVEQPVDLPVRAWGGTGGRLQGFLPGQFSSSSVEQNVDIPVPHGRDRVGGGLLGLHPGLQRLPSRSLTFQFRVVAEFFILHRRLPVCRVWQIKGFSSHLTPCEKVRGQVRTWGRNWVRTLLHPRCWLSRRVSSGTVMVIGWSFQAVGGNFWARIQKFGGLGGWDGALVAVGRISSPMCLRSSHL